MKIITGDNPLQEGVYVVFEDVYVPYARKVLLTFLNNEWHYTSSDQKFRGNILGYIGPIPSPRVEEIISKEQVFYAIGTLPDGLHGSFLGGPFHLRKEALDAIGFNGWYLFKLFSDKDPEIIAKWSEKKMKWLRKKQ